ncbi:MAG: radical SAM protein [Chlamydiota bacterium]
MNVLLIHPPILIDEVMKDFKKFERMRGLYPPLGILYIAASLIEAGHAVRVVDCDAEDDWKQALEKACAGFRPVVAGFYAFTWNYRNAAAIATMVKRMVPGITTVIGGPNATSFPSASLELGDFDVAVKGEGEIIARELLAALAEGRPLGGVEGISWKEGGAVRETKNRDYIKDLDTVPFPARHLVRMDRYSDIFARERKFTTMIATRGCPFSCTFCNKIAKMGKILRARSPKNIVEEIRMLQGEYGVREVMFFDDNFILDKAWAHELCREITRSGLKFLWEIRTRVDTVDEGVLRAIRGAGCYRIRFGFESGDDATLKNLKKGITTAQSRESARLCHKVGLEMFGYFILGAPGETEETMKKTIALAIDLEPRFALFSKFVPYPCTEAFDWAVARGYISSNYWLDLLAGRDLDSHPATDQRQLPAKVVEEYLDLANRRFYFRPRYILTALRTLKSPAQFWRYLRIAASLV